MLNIVLRLKNMVDEA